MIIHKKLLIILLISFCLVYPWVSRGQTDEQTNQEVKAINQQIQDKKNSITKIQQQQEVYNQAIKQKQSEKASLANELSILENRLAKAALDIDSAQTEIDRTNLEMEKINLDIKDKDEQIQKTKDHMADVISLMQKQDDKSSLEILLQNDNLNDFVNQIKYLEDINKEIKNNLDDLKQLKSGLEQKQQELTDKRKELDQLKASLEDKKLALAAEQDNKNYILEQTKSSESQYQRLLKAAIAEQQKAQADIVNLEKVARDKLAKMSGKKLEFNDAGFIWPVTKNIIVASFHDPDYPFRYIFEHPAIDIRASQGSTIRAAASGYVAIAKDAGMGYSYIMIIHGNGLATVYGHVSKIYVKPDDYVVQGQTIGLSGGMPGTRGAGPLTTGPHLHFEVRLNGVPVDPEEYLP